VKKENVTKVAVNIIVLVCLVVTAAAAAANFLGTKNKFVASLVTLRELNILGLAKCSQI